jgi:DNA repair protein RadC
MKSIQIVKIQMIKESRMTYDYENIKGPKIIAEIFRKYIGDADREHAVVACLDSKNKINSLTTVSIGSLNSGIIQPREVFKTAILSNSASIILAHNHPSGDPNPSSEDIQSTLRLVEAGQILGIDVLDHIILGDEGKFISLKEKDYF